jgi:hypothetical protein
MRTRSVTSRENTNGSDRRDAVRCAHCPVTALPGRAGPGPAAARNRRLRRGGHPAGVRAPRPHLLRTARTQPPTPAHAAAPPTRPISAGRIQVLMRRHGRAIISARNTAMLEAVADRRLPGRRIARPRTGPPHREASDRVSNGCSTRLVAREGRWGRSCLVGTTAHSAHQSVSLVSVAVSSSGLRRRFRRRSPRTAWVAGRALVVLRPRPRRPSRRGWP